MKHLTRLLCTLALSMPLMAAAQQQTMLNNIEQAKNSLSSTENRIVKQRVALSSTLGTLEKEVLALRDKTAVARRLADEKTLSLSKLEDRLKEWKDQQNYQQNLLNRFLQQQGLRGSDVAAMNTGAKMAAIADVAADQSQLPAWQTNTLVLDSGELTDVPALRVGPVTWFIHGEDVGLAEWVSGRLQTKGMLPSSLASDMQNGNAALVVDATLGRALTREAANEGIIEHVVKGGIWVVPILLFALIATVIGLMKVVQLFRLPKVIPVRSQVMLNKMLNAGEAARSQFKGMQANLLAITEQAASARERDDQLFVQLQQDRQVLDKWINAVAVTAAVAPLLGLLGTVSGMIETFRMMTSFGSSDPEVISGGIAKALVTTELGLIVAIPALILNALLSRKARQYYTGLENFALVLSGDEAPAEYTNPAQNSDSAELMGSAHPAGAG